MTLNWQDIARTENLLEDIAISLKRIADSLEKSYELTKQSMPQPDANLDAMVAAHEPKYPTQGQT